MSQDPASADKHRVQERARHASRKAQMALVPVQPGEGGLAYASRALPGGKESLVELARLSPHESVKAIVTDWDAMTGRKRSATRLEVMCEAREIAPADFLGEVVKAAFEHNTDVAKMILAVNTPRLVQKSVREALTKKGFKDREMLMQASGIAPKGGGMHITQVANAQAKATAAAQHETKGLPAFEAEVIDASEAVRSDE